MLRRYSGTHYVPGMAMLGCLFLSVPAAIYAVYIYRKAQSTLRWRIVQGYIVESYVDEKDVQSWSGQNNALSSLSRKMRYRPAINYQYTIGENTYNGNCIFFGDKEWRRSNTYAHDITSKFPTNTSSRVYVNPKNLNESVLERGQLRVAMRYLWITFGLLMGAIILWAIGDRPHF